jgi:hypothetical protein
MVLPVAWLGFLSPEKMAAPDRKYEKKKKKSQLFIQFPYIWLSNSKYVEHRNSIFLV